MSIVLFSFSLAWYHHPLFGANCSLNVFNIVQWSLRELWWCLLVHHPSLVKPGSNTWNIPLAMRIVKKFRLQCAIFWLADHLHSPDFRMVSRFWLTLPGTSSIMWWEIWGGGVLGLRVARMSETHLRFSISSLTAFRGSWVWILSQPGCGMHQKAKYGFYEKSRITLFIRAFLGWIRGLGSNGYCWRIRLWAFFGQTGTQQYLCRMWW